MRAADPSDRGRRSPLRDYPAVLWLLAAVVLAFVHREVPASGWLLVHLVLLGALSHSILVWSMHFARAVLRVRVDEVSQRGQAWRISLMFLGTLLVLLGVPGQWWWLVLVGAVGVTTSAVWHGLTLWRMLRDALTARFRITIRYYLAAVAWLAVGVTGGVVLATGLADPWHGRILLVHTMANLLGWVGMTVTGTLVTFWPTILRTRMDDRAVGLATRALPVLTAGLAVLVTGGLVGLQLLGLAGLVVYAGGLAWWARALIRPLRTKPPREFSPASVGCALAWGVVGILAVGHQLATAADWAEYGAGSSRIAGIFAAGFGAQLLLGALSHLVPTVLGGGPRAVRAAVERFNTWATARLVVANGGMVLFLLPTPSWVRVIVSAVVVLALATFLPIMVLAIRDNVRVRREQEVTSAARVRMPPLRSIWSGRQLVAGLAILGVASAVGIGLDPGAAGFQGTTTARSGAAVEPTGQTVRVEVSARDMRFHPEVVAVDAGDRLVLTVTNDDPSTTHDLRVGDVTTPRLGPGESAELDVGVVTGPLDGRCTIAGHAAQGMVFAVEVAGEGAPAQAAPGPGAFIPPVPDAELAEAIDPVLPPLGEETVHELTLTVTEAALEVAPGQWQTRWTFNGGSVGPTLHGRVGDVFEITLVNDGSMGHSIDFHAGALAPDRPMRTIQPGESLVYRFTAERAGAWLYHCATAPMSTHVAAGMYGAVVIEPGGLPEVDRSYLLVQSEVFLANDARSAEEAQEVDGAKVQAQTPDRVVFNGVAHQYDQHPLPARVGERIRLWTVNAGPNRPSSLHVIGGQFDTTYLEGAHLLDRGRDAFGNEGGGSQALGVLPAQGGFVEVVFPEAGHYPVVSHVMGDAERGAHGIVEVTD